MYLIIPRQKFTVTTEYERGISHRAFVPDGYATEYRGNSSVPHQRTKLSHKI